MNESPFSKEDLDRQTVTMASIYPQPVLERRPFQPMSTFMLAAAPCPNPKDEYTTLTIPYCFQGTYRGESIGTIPMPQQAIVVAHDMWNCWVKMTPHYGPECGPGIIILKGDKPTAAEMTTMKTMQRNYALVLVDEASEWHRDGKGKLIQPIHRLMAQYLQLGSDIAWLPEYKAGERKNCPLCQKLVPIAAIICPECKYQIAEMPKELARLNAMEQKPVQVGR